MAKDHRTLDEKINLLTVHASVNSLKWMIKLKKKKKKNWKWNTHITLHSDLTRLSLNAIDWFCKSHDRIQSPFSHFFYHVYCNEFGRTLLLYLQQMSTIVQIHQLQCSFHTWPLHKYNMPMQLQTKLPIDILLEFSNWIWTLILIFKHSLSNRNHIELYKKKHYQIMKGKENESAFKSVVKYTK